MTREEAIDLLDNLNGMIEDSRNSDYDTAFKMAIKALEQESKSEWEHDHEILKAYSDGANDVLDKIRAEIEDLDRHYDNDYFSGNKDAMFKCSEVLEIIDKYKAESEDKE